MFVLKNWLKDNIIKGFNNGEVSSFKVAELSTNYMLKGVFVESDVADIANETTEKVIPVVPTDEEILDDLPPEENGGEEI